MRYYIMLHIIFKYFMHIYLHPHTHYEFKKFKLFWAGEFLVILSHEIFAIFLSLLS